MLRTNPIASDPALASIKGLRLLPDGDLTTKTTMKSRCRAALLVEAHTGHALRQLLMLAKEREWPLMVLGGGSNTIFATQYFEGVVVQLGRQVFGQAHYLGDNIVRVGCAKQLTSVIKFAHRSGLMGLEFCTKIPGQVGGALAGNAGAGNWGVCDFVERVTYMTRSGRVATLDRGEFRYAYRASELAHAVILEAELRLEPLREDVAAARIAEFDAKKVNQPYDKPSSGCVFKNPVCPRTGSKLFAGKLIDEAGLKGYSLNSAKVSDTHANFIINEGEASGEDFLALINLIEDVVLDKFGVQLEVEARIVGGPLTSTMLY